MSMTDRKSATARDTMIVDTYELAQQIAAIRADLQSLTSAVGGIAQDKAMDAARQAEQTIRQNPLSAVAIAAGLGFLFGIFMWR